MVENFDKEELPVEGDSTKEDTTGVIDPNRTLEVTASKIEDGVHTGKITKIMYRDEPFAYVDIYIMPDGVDLELKVGYPQRISPGSGLGQLFERSGINLTKGQNINLYTLLVTKQVKFQTNSEVVKIKDKETGKPVSMTVARIMKETVRLV